MVAGSNVAGRRLEHLQGAIANFIAFNCSVQGIFHTRGAIRNIRGTYLWVNIGSITQ